MLCCLRRNIDCHNEIIVLMLLLLLQTHSYMLGIIFVSNYLHTQHTCLLLPHFINLEFTRNFIAALSGKGIFSCFFRYRATSIYTNDDFNAKLWMRMHVCDSLILVVSAIICNFLGDRCDNTCAMCIVFNWKLVRICINDYVSKCQLLLLFNYYTRMSL